VDDDFGLKVGMVIGALILIAVSLWAVDCGFGRSETWACQVVDHGHQNPYWTPVVECGGKPNHCTTHMQYHPERWWLVYRQPLAIGGGHAQSGVSQNQWYAVQDGDTIAVHYRVGRLTKHYWAIGVAL
jgi:hypothetical protein